MGKSFKRLPNVWDLAGPSQPEPSQTKPGRAELSRAASSRIERSQAVPNRDGIWAGPEPEPSLAELDRAEQIRARPSQAKPRPAMPKLARLRQPRTIPEQQSEVLFSPQPPNRNFHESLTFLQGGLHFSPSGRPTRNRGKQKFGNLLDCLKPSLPEPI